jgi:IPT/TIG domain
MIERVIEAGSRPISAQRWSSSALRRAAFSNGTQYTYTVRSDESINTQTVAQNPALVDVQVCGVTGCSPNPPTDYLYLYPPGNPKVTSVRPGSGPAAGGTKVTIGGQNLGCVTKVFFGKVVAEKFSNAKALLDCGSTSLVHATVPPGQAGTTVKVSVTTVESGFTGTGPSKSSAGFTYTP